MRVIADGRVPAPRISSRSRRTTSKPAWMRWTRFPHSLRGSGVPRSGATSHPELPALDCCPQLTVDVRAVQEDIPLPLRSGVRAEGTLRSAEEPVLLVATIVRCYPTERSRGRDARCRQQPSR